MPSPVFAYGGMVATSQPLAAEAGARILREGGTAVDAAVATAAALAVTEPTSTGIGGDAFALVYEGGSVHALNGSGRAPVGLDLGRLEADGFDAAHPLPATHIHTVTVPGACSAWTEAVARFGRLPLATVLAPAIELAEEGFPVAPVTSFFWGRSETLLQRQPGGEAFLIDGRAPRAGERFRNPALAGTLRAVAAGGGDAFYEGAIAEAIAARVAQLGGALTAGDLAAHQADWVDPIATTYRGVRLWECPPNGQGLTALLALNILAARDEEYRSARASRNDAWMARHMEIEALRLAFADAAWYLADPTVTAVPVAELLSPAYAVERAARIDPRRAMAEPERGRPVASSDTVYLTVVDAEGRACSFINSNYMGFGTGIVPEGCGFTLQNRGHNFSLDPAHPNRLEPGKRPYHTIIPAILTRAEDDALLASYGVMGGFMQPQGHLQVLMNLLDGDDPQVALDRPRFCLERDDAGTVALETGHPTGTVAALRAAGHRIRPVSGWRRAIFGRGQIVARDPETGLLSGGSDQRADGQAAPVSSA